MFLVEKNTNITQQEHHTEHYHLHHHHNQQQHQQQHQHEVIRNKRPLIVKSSRFNVVILRKIYMHSVGNSLTKFVCLRVIIYGATEELKQCWRQNCLLSYSFLFIYLNTNGSGEQHLFRYFFGSSFLVYPQPPQPNHISAKSTK